MQRRQRFLNAALLALFAVGVAALDARSRRSGRTCSLCVPVPTVSDRQTFGPAVERTLADRPVEPPSASGRVRRRDEQ